MPILLLVYGQNIDHFKVSKIILNSFSKFSKHYLKLQPSLYLIKLDKNIIGAASIDNGSVGEMCWDDAEVRLAFIDPDFNQYKSFIKHKLVETCSEIDKHKY